MVSQNVFTECEVESSLVVLERSCSCGGEIVYDDINEFTVSNYPFRHVCTECGNQFFFEETYPAVKARGVSSTECDLNFKDISTSGSIGSLRTECFSAHIPGLGTVQSCKSCSCLFTGGGSLCGLCLDNVPDLK